MGNCQSCALIRRRDVGAAPLWDAILRTDHWDIVHADSSSIEGWLVLALRRHAVSVAELTEAEAAELGPLLRRLSIALRRVTGCVKTYVVQFAEHPDHQHVHVHLVPRAADLPDDAKGVGIFSRLGVAEDDQVPPDRKDAFAEALRADPEIAACVTDDLSRHQPDRTLDSTA